MDIASYRVNFKSCRCIFQTYYKIQSGIVLAFLERAWWNMPNPQNWPALIILQFADEIWALLGAFLSATNCNKELIFGKWTFLGLLFPNISSHPMISQIHLSVTSHFTTLYLYQNMCLGSLWLISLGGADQWGIYGTDPPRGQLPFSLLKDYSPSPASSTL